MNTNTKHWAFTWETNKLQKKLPKRNTLDKVLMQLMDTCTYQTECGKVANKLHYQGVFTLQGPRKSKKQVLELFKERVGNVSGLTLSRVYDKEAIMKYVTKEDTRIEGPFKVGKNDAMRLEFESAELNDWQADLYKYLVYKSSVKEFRDRKIIWVEDRIGCTGKSFFQKWLRLGQQALVCRKLPVSSVERLISAATKLFSHQKVDVIMIDLPRTQGQDQSLDDLFCTIEDLKNGYMVDTMYGKYNETLFTPPMIIVFTNKSFKNYSQKLSQDRWVSLFVNRDKQIEHFVYNEDGTITPTSLNKLINQD